jgi:hypothetical protein
MQKPLGSDERLKMLQTVDNHRRWYSLDDKRLCAVCERIINGHQIEVRGGPDGYTLHCPTPDCPSNFSHWFLYHESGVTGSTSKAGSTDGAVPSRVATGRAEMSFLSWANR